MSVLSALSDGGRTFGETLERGERLPAVPLLNTDVDVIGLGSDVLVVSEWVALVGEGIWMEQISS